MDEVVLLLLGGGPMFPNVLCERQANVLGTFTQRLRERVFEVGFWLALLSSKQCA